MRPDAQLKLSYESETEMVKMNNGLGSVMMVYTGESPDQIIKTGVVTTPMPFNLFRSENCKYVVCCQNATVDGATEAHNSAFLIGIVTGSNAAEMNGKSMGVSLNISHYVLISKRDAWYAKRNVSHFFFDSLTDAKIRLGRYDFTPIVKEESRLRSGMIVTARRPSRAMANKVATRIVKRDKFPVDNVPETEQEVIPTSMESDLRAFIASRLNVKPSQVNVTVTISI